MFKWLSEIFVSIFGSKPASTQSAPKQAVAKPAAPVAKKPVDNTKKKKSTKKSK